MTDHDEPGLPSDAVLPSEPATGEEPRPGPDLLYPEESGSVDRRKAPRGPRPQLIEESEPLFRTESGYRLRLEPRDLAKLRELPGSKGKSDRELGEQFFDGHAAKLAASLASDVAPPAEVLVFVDPYSRQTFLAVGSTIRGIVSF